MPDDILLTVTPSCRFLSTLDQVQLVYLLAELKRNPAIVPVPMPVNLSLVLDQSGSMEDGHKLEHLKQAVHHIIDQLDDEDYLSMVTFSGGATTLLSATKVGKLRRKDLKRRISGVSVLWTGTDIAPALAVARREIGRNAANNRVNRILLLTDGQVYVADGDHARAEKECLREADRCGREGVPILALGLGDDWSEVLLVEIAERSRGQADYVARPQDISAFFSSATQAMQAVSAKNVIFSLRSVAGVTPRKVWRVMPLISDMGTAPLTDRRVGVSLGELEQEGSLALLVELIVNPRSPGSYRIAQAEISYDMPVQSMTGEKVKADIVVQVVPGTGLDHQLDARVMNVVERVTAFKLQTRALDDAQVGDLAGAQQKLANAVTMLLNQGETDLAHHLQAEADRLGQGQQVSSEGRKTIQFTSRKTVKL